MEDAGGFEEVEVSGNTFFYKYDEKSKNCGTMYG